MDYYIIFNRKVLEIKNVFDPWLTWLCITGLSECGFYIFPSLVLVFICSIVFTLAKCALDNSLSNTYFEKQVKQVKQVKQNDKLQIEWNFLVSHYFILCQWTLPVYQRPRSSEKRCLCLPFQVWQGHLPELHKCKGSWWALLVGISQWGFIFIMFCRPKIDNTIAGYF